MPMPRTDQPAKGFEILAGFAAVSLINRSTGQFVLNLTDVHLPDADGLGVLRAARCEPVDAGRNYHRYASLDSAITAVRLGAYDYLTKPFSLGQIDVVMARVTASRSRKRIVRPCVG